MGLGLGLGSGSGLAVGLGLGGGLGLGLGLGLGVGVGVHERGTPRPPPPSSVKQCEGGDAPEAKGTGRYCKAASGATQAIPIERARACSARPRRGPGAPAAVTDVTGSCAAPLIKMTCHCAPHPWPVRCRRSCRRRFVLSHPRWTPAPRRRSRRRSFRAPRRPGRRAGNGRRRARQNRGACAARAPPPSAPG